MGFSGALCPKTLAFTRKASMLCRAGGEAKPIVFRAPYRPSPTAGLRLASSWRLASDPGPKITPGLRPNRAAVAGGVEAGRSSALSVLSNASVPAAGGPPQGAATPCARLGPGPLLGLHALRPRFPFALALADGQ